LDLSSTIEDQVGEITPKVVERQLIKISKQSSLSKKSTRMFFLPFSPVKGVYVAFILEDEKNIVEWIKRRV
jgi:hypothetical protein